MKVMEKMIHQYKLNGYNIILDVCRVVSGALLAAVFVMWLVVSDIPKVLPVVIPG